MEIVNFDPNETSFKSSKEKVQAALDPAAKRLNKVLEEKGCLTEEDFNWIFNSNYDPDMPCNKNGCDQVIRAICCWRPEQLEYEKKRRKDK